MIHTKNSTILIESIITLSQIESVDSYMNKEMIKKIFVALSETNEWSGV